MFDKETWRRTLNDNDEFYSWIAGAGIAIVALAVWIVPSVGIGMVVEHYTKSGVWAGSAILLSLVVWGIVGLSLVFYMVARDKMIKEAKEALSRKERNEPKSPSGYGW